MAFSCLQAVLLDLFRQMQAQSAAISKLQQSLGVLDAREREGSTAARQAAEAASVQAQCAANALAVLDVQLADEREAAKQHRRETDERLQHLELRLHGASNLAGRQAALDDIASMLGIIVPEVGARGCWPAAVVGLLMDRGDNCKGRLRRCNACRTEN